MAGIDASRNGGGASRLGHDGAVVAEDDKRQSGWLVLTILSAVMVALSLIALIASLVVGNLEVPLGVPWIVFWYWVAVGAWRRANGRVAPPKPYAT
jgi:hypothetical protein